MRAIRICATVAVAAFCLAPAFGEDAATSSQPTFYKDIVPILQENCQACHREAGQERSEAVAQLVLIGRADRRHGAPVEGV